MAMSNAKSERAADALTPSPLLATQADETRCRNCGRRSFYSTYRQTPGAEPEPDYDPNDDPVTWRHAGGYASCLRSATFAEPRPPIITLCGSTRFPEAWAKARYDLTLAGYIVLTIGCDTKSDEGLGISEDQKIALDALHKHKINLSDEILVLNVGGYFGDSTRSEIAHADAVGIPVSYLEPEVSA